MPFLWPVEGDFVVFQSFGEHPGDYGTACRADGSHNGLDLAVVVGRRVFAAHPGVVKFAGLDKTGYGLCVWLEGEQGAGTIYAHLSEISVRVGEMVHAGAVLGKTGNTGNSTGPHLHFEYRTRLKDCKTCADPLPLMGIPPVPVIPATPVSAETFSAGDVIRVGDDELNLRPVPGTERERLGRLRPGTTGKVERVQGVWLQVTVTGWVHSGYVKRAG